MEAIGGLTGLVLLLVLVWYFGKAISKAGTLAEKAVIIGSEMGDNRLSVLAAESKLAKAERFANINVDKKTVDKAKSNAKLLDELDF